jgi:hypothetical protein
MGECTLDVSGNGGAAWFSTVSASTAQGSVKITCVAGEEFTSDDGDQSSSTAARTVTLAKKPAHEPLRTAGMYMTLPYSPRYSGDTFGVNVRANTGGKALSSWTVEISFVPELLQLNSWSTSGLFNSPTANTGTSGKLVLVVAGIKSSTAKASVTTADLSLVSLTFAIRSVAASGSVTAREFDSALVAVVKDMVDTNTETFVTDVPVKAHDARGGIHVSGQLTVAFARAVGVFSYAARSAEVYNVAPLGASAATAETVAVTMLYSRNAASDAAVAGGSGSGLVCSTGAASDAILVGAASSVAGGCALTLVKEGAVGAAAVKVVAAIDGFTATAPLRVWAPTEVSVSVKDDALDPVDPALTGSGCSGSGGALVYQRSDFHVLATFSDGAVSVAELDVTCDVSVAPSAPGVVIVMGGSLQGAAPGWGSAR